MISVHTNARAIMDETVFFEGRLRKRSLPVFEGPPPSEAEGPKRLLLAQGELANFYDGPEGMRYMAFMELRPGTVRGNHLHRIKVEHVYLVSGQLLLVAQDGARGKRVEIKLRPGDLVSIGTGIAHAFRPIEAGHGIEFSPARFNAGDLEKCALI